TRPSLFLVARRIRCARRRLRQLRRRAHGARRPQRIRQVDAAAPRGRRAHADVRPRLGGRGRRRLPPAAAHARHRQPRGRAEGRPGPGAGDGSRKPPLTRLAAGELTPTSGRVSAGGADVAYLPQKLTLDTGMRVAELLGVARPLDAVRAIADGDVDPARFDEVGDDWDIEARAHAALAEAGLAPDMLDGTVGGLSGGEAMLAALTGVRLSGSAVTLLDEPTNNLDRDARRRVQDLVRSWRGALVVVSHDLDLLDLMDET